MPVRAGANHFVGFGALGAVGALPAAVATDVAGQDQANDVAQTCIYQPNIDHTKILDDRTILFFMRTRVTYQNTLPETCYSLYAEKRFTYGSASMHRLCAGNLVLTDLTPGAVSRGNLCKLGLFVPVGADEVDELIAASESRSKKDKGGRPQALTAVPVELPPTTESRPESTESQAPQPAQPPPPAAPNPAPAEPNL